VTFDVWESVLVATIVIEGAVALVVAGRGMRRAALLCSVFANFLTHPLLTILHGIHDVPLPPLELAVMAVEALAYRRAAGLSWRRAITVSIVANGVTWGISVLL
jgi:hypothetical protein